MSWFTQQINLLTNSSVGFKWKTTKTVIEIAKEEGMHVYYCQVAGNSYQQLN